MAKKNVSRVKTKKKAPAKRGRKTYYTPDRIERICKVIAQGGTDKAAFEAGGISQTQFYEWLNEKPEFAEAVKNARRQFQEWQDKEMVKKAQASLVRLICGEEYTETTSEFGLDENNQPIQKKQKQVTKKVLPNVTAIIFALTNRDSERWKNRMMQEVKGKIETEQKNDVSLSKIPDDLLRKVIDSLRGE